MNQYSEDVINAVKSFGLLSYPLEKIVNLISDITGEEIDKTSFKKDFNDPSSSIYNAYHKGRDMADYQINKKLFEMAKSGDLKALDEMLRWQRRMNNK